ncbi:hypothetical protein H0H81_010561 [Sphagnurus paluster]|uniref:Uncharacterized protein n=1 Tax=Sphagnurus paluster TaxID=117069 RepID=A0A9P7GJK9_9AGAR|nr:hypothetical protein H0H81_010561 [Sphagnurus paluster]
MNKLGDPQDINTQYAALSVRVNLDFDTERQLGREQEEKLVESHLRVVFAIPKHREFMRTGTPSEPLLAEAARRLLQKLQPLERVPTLLVDAFSSGFLARGDRGELVMRTLYILARDVAMERGLADKPLIGSQICAPVRVLDWLRALLTEPLYNVALNARPVGDENGLTLAEAFEDSWLNFSHFANAGDFSVPSIDYLVGCNVRGMGLQCAPNQRSIDGMNGLHVGIDKPICKENTSGLLTQAKARVIVEEHIIDPTIIGETKHAVMGIVMEFGSDKSQVDVTSFSPPMTISGWNPYAKFYQLVVHGVTSETYGVIPSAMDDKYKTLIAGNKIMDDFPREGDYRDAMLRQKPAFLCEPVCWDWMRNNYPN